MYRRLQHNLELNARLADRVIASPAWRVGCARLRGLYRPSRSPGKTAWQLQTISATHTVFAALSLLWTSNLQIDLKLF